MLDVNLGLDCIYYHVSDLDGAIEFYRDILGLRFVSRDAVARFEVDGVLVELVPTEDRHKLSGEGNARLCLAVPNVAATLQALQQHGVKVFEPEDKGDGILAILLDPDGNQIALWQSAGGQNKSSMWV